jgi:Xaa-Pro aminopeptidase
MMHEDRILEAQRRMKDNRIDAYMIMTHDDYNFFFGDVRHQPRAILPANGKPIVIAFRGEKEEIQQSMGMQDVRVFSTVGQQMKDVVNVMQEIKGDKPTMTVGFQMLFGTPAFLINLFSKMNPQIKVVDIAPVMEEMKLVKTAEEIALVRKASQIAVMGMAKAKEVLREGITENEVAAEAEYVMRKAGASGTATPIFVNSGVRSGWLHGTATDKIIAEGDLVVVDLVPKYKGYCSNICRTFIVGKADEHQREMHETYRKAQLAAITRLLAGKKMKDMDEAARAVFAEAGFGDYFVSGFGHGIGLNFEEKPMPTIVPGDISFVMRSNMLITAGHSILSVPGVGGVRMEDVFLIGENSSELLTQFPYDL